MANVEGELFIWEQLRLVPTNVDTNFKKLAQEIAKCLDLSTVTGTAAVGNVLKVSAISPKILFEYGSGGNFAVEETLTVATNAQVNFVLSDVFLATSYRMFLFIDGIRFDGSHFTIVNNAGSNTTITWTDSDISLITANEVIFKAEPIV